jgi:hypothetical protein
MKLLAASDDQAAKHRLKIIPAVPFIDVKILMSPNKSIGIMAYPKVLIMLYSGISSIWDMKLNKKNSKRFPNTNIA